MLVAVFVTKICLDPEESHKS